MRSAALREPAPNGAYRTARVYAEGYNSRCGTGLIPKSLPMVKEMVAVWSQYDVLPVSGPQSQQED